MPTTTDPLIMAIRPVQMSRNLSSLLVQYVRLSYFKFSSCLYNSPVTGADEDIERYQSRRQEVCLTYSYVRLSWYDAGLVPVLISLFCETVSGLRFFTQFLFVRSFSHQEHKYVVGPLLHCFVLYSC
jgi:hypothetical protein